RVVLTAAYGGAGLFTLLALALIAGHNDRRAEIAEMEAVIARAEQAGSPVAPAFPPRRSIPVKRRNWPRPRCRPICKPWPKLIRSRSR
ncbi:MAG: hypothetical protein HC783_00675, partial [Rhodobacteraceae bacterium]|nr:hypothetical protein [Paracoccaceae bacterium]